MRSIVAGCVVWFDKRATALFCRLPNIMRGMKTENNALIILDDKRQARLMYWAGYRIAQIAEILNLSASTVSSWKERENWDKTAPIGRIEAVIEARLCLLLAKNDKTGKEKSEIDFLMRQIERTARVKKYSNGGGNEADLNPKIKNRNKGERKAADKNPITQEQEELLINGLLATMFPYQRQWHEAGLKHRIRNILKSRQIGATYFFALESFVDALKTGRNQIFISASKKQALQFRSYIVDYAKRTADVELKGETIVLPNAAELIFLGTNSKTAQSYHGNLYFDEIFWVPRFEEIRKVASAMASQKKYRQTYFSTPSTLAHSAYPFWSGKRFNRGRPKAQQGEFDISHEFLKCGRVGPDNQWRQIVNIYDAEAGGCNLFDIHDLKLEYSADEFEQLFMCQFIDDNESVFKFSMLQRCQVDSLEIWKDFNPLYLRPFGNREVWLGYDPAFTGDRAALAIVAPPRVEGGNFRTLHYQTFHGMDFAQQAERIRHYCDCYNITRIGIDMTGLGTGVYQIVKTFRPDAVGYQYNPDLKNRMVLKAFDVISKGRMEWDSNGNDIPASFMSIKKQLTASGKQTTYVADRSEEASHGDIAWAIMQTLINEPFEGSSAVNNSFMEIYS